MIRWFVVQVHTGCELQAASGIADLNLRAIAPRLRQRRKERPDMTWRQKQSIRQQPVVEVSLFPGYILAAFDRDNDQWGGVKRAPGVIGLVPIVGERPIPIPIMEADRLISRLDTDGFWIDKPEEKPWQKRPLEIGQTVRVADGAFTGFPAMVELSEGERVRVLVEIFGRHTPVELDWDQVEVA